MKQVVAVSFIWSFINLALTTCANAQFREIELKRAENLAKEVRLYEVRDQLRAKYKQCAREGNL